MKKILTCIILSIIIFINTTFTCYASETVSNLLSWSSIPDKIKEWSNIPLEQKLMMFYNTVAVSSGIVPDGKISKASLDYWLEYCLGKQEKTVADMTENELDALLETYYGKLKEKGTGFNSKGEFVTSDTVINDYRTFFNNYSKDNVQPLYYTVEVPCIGENNINASAFGSTYVYKTIKYFVEQLGDCYCWLQGDIVSIVPLGDVSKNEYFCLFYKKQNNVTPNNDFYVYEIYNGTNEQTIFTTRGKNTMPVYKINLTVDKSDVLSLDDDRISYMDINSFSVSSSCGAYYSRGVTLDRFYKSVHTLDNSNATIVTKKDRYIKLFTSLANYQDYITSTYEPQVFYTSNYYKTENIQESAIPLDQMVNLYNCYDELCQKILQYVKDTQNANDTAVIKKLDELIKAVYSTGSVPSGGSSGGSSDVIVNIDMSETNSILNKILEEIKKFHSTKIDIDNATDNPLTDWAKKLSNMVKNPEININATVGDMGSVFTKVTDKLKCKFPFSIPWDIFFLLAFLADTPEVPKYEIPFKLENYGIDEVLVIDFEQFSVVSKISRMLLTILYMVALMNLTIKVLGIGKDK